MNASGGGVHTAAHADTDRQRRVAWLWLLVILQLVIPASYYVRGERDDERFAWRMFSAVRVQRCRVSALAVDATGTETAIEPRAVLHSAWVRALERGRERVIERFLDRQCARRPSVRTDLLRRCQDAAQRDLGREHFALDCRTRRFTRERLP